MIIDLILERKHREEQIKEGATHYITYPNMSKKFIGEVDNGDGTISVPLAYNPKQFYLDVMEYGKTGYNITRAMDGGEEYDVKRELARYIIDNRYSLEIISYINSVNWL